MRHQAGRIIQLPRRKLQLLQPASLAHKKDAVVGIALRPRRDRNNYVCFEETLIMLMLVTALTVNFNCSKFHTPCRKKNGKFDTAGKLSSQRSQVYARYFWEYESISENLLEENVRD